VYHRFRVPVHWIEDRGGSAQGDLTCAVGHRLTRSDGTLDGIYAGWRWTGHSLEIEQDRYGFFPLFEWRTPDARVVSTDVAALIERGAPADLDLDALAVFVRLGFFVGADTPYRAIRAVLPPALPRARNPISRPAAIDGFIDLFKAGISRRLPTAPYVMPLSGGRDSRHILFALRDAGYPPDACVTVRHFPPRANDDELVARELCQTLSIAHRVIPQPRDRASLERRKNVETHACSDEHGQFVALADHLRSHTHETYDGIAGDVLSQSSYLTPVVHDLFQRGDIGGVARFVLGGYGSMTSETALARVLARDLYRSLSRERAVARLSEELARHVDAQNPTGAFFFANRTRREIALAPYGLMRDLLVHAPYVDVDLYDFLSGLPASILMDRTLHTEALARAWPQYAHVPYERKGLTTPDRASGRALARALARVVMRDDVRRWIRPSGLLPGVAASALDGRADRLWHASLLFYLAHLAEVATSSSCGPRVR